MDISETLSTTEVMARLRLARATVIRLIERGDLQAYKKTPGKTSGYRISIRSVQDLERKRVEQLNGP